MNYSYLVVLGWCLLRESVCEAVTKILSEIPKSLEYDVGTNTVDRSDAFLKLLVPSYLKGT